MLRQVTDSDLGPVQPRRTTPCRRPGSGGQEEARLLNTAGGAFWMAAGLIGMIGLLFTPEAVNRPLVLAISTICISISLFDWIWRSSSTSYLVLSTLGAAPLLALMMYGSGGFDSPYRPLIFLLVGFCAYFMPLRQAWLPMAEAALAFASPLLYAGPAQATNILLGLSLLVPTTIVLAATVMLTRKQMVQAERQARQLALRDPLTGVANLRAFGTGWSLR